MKNKSKITPKFVAPCIAWHVDDEGNIDPVAVFTFPFKGDESVTQVISADNDEYRCNTIELYPSYKAGYTAALANQKENLKSLEMSLAKDQEKAMNEWSEEIKVTKAKIACMISELKKIK